MASRRSNRSLSLLLFLLPIIIIMILKTNSTPTYLSSNCVKHLVNPISTYQTHLRTLLHSLSSNATAFGGFYNTSVGNNDDDNDNDTSSEAIYGLFLCRGDQNATGCGDCVNTAATDELPSTYCPGAKEAVIWYNECMLRYSNVSFFGLMSTDPIGYVAGSDTHMWDSHLYNTMHTTMNSMVDKTANNNSGLKFATKEVNISGSIFLYALQQCTPDIKADDCKRCLRNAIHQLNLYSSSFALSPSCNVRYESYPFYNGAVNYTASKGGSRRTDGKKQVSRRFMFAAIPTSIALSLFLLLLSRSIYMRKRKALEAYRVEIDELRTEESLQFSLSRIRTATRNFSIDNKLGQGGFGEVYKGITDGGQQIAVKRLSKDSGQGVVEFKNEVLLVARIQHKNLVKLLGFCVESMEKILVYEFLPNSSLDHLLYDPVKKASLDWLTRYNIILGVARGLLYLHEDSRLTIIHRDLKPSNILLDESMNPKISDFGMAKLFDVDETQGDTRRIVGTYGYMAPEYAISGHYSIKSDIYSFGVIMLEIVSGQRSSFFGRPWLEEALLHRAWRLWNEDKPLDLVDPTLGSCGNFPTEEIVKCIHIGLLCVQEEAIARPRMTTIVSALRGQSISMPSPKLPYFFGSDDTINDEDYHHTTPIYSGTEHITDVYSRD